MNLTAYCHLGTALFARRVRTRKQARQEVVFNPMAYRAAYVIYKNKEYTIQEVYTW